MLLATAALALAAAQAPALTLKPCAVESTRARCGTYLVPERYAKPQGRKIALRVVVVPAWGKQKAPDAVAYLAGGPGGAATDLTQMLAQEWPELIQHRDLLLVDQRGTGNSNSFVCAKPTTALGTSVQIGAYVARCLADFGGDASQYGTRAAMEDLDRIRAALGYRKLDVVGGSYGATAAEMYLRLHPESVRSVVLLGATALDVPFWDHWATNAQHALDQVARRCDTDAACHKAFPGWKAQLARLVTRWNAHPATVARGTTLTGDQLAGLVQGMLLGLDQSVALPHLVARAARGDYRALNAALAAATSAEAADDASRLVMFWSIWCNEPWVGLGAAGPWHTIFDGAAAASLAGYRRVCAVFPRRSEPRSLWTMPSSTRVPVLALEGGADPQDPASNLPGLKRHFPDSRTIVLPWFGHHFSNSGCIATLITDFVERGTTRGLDTMCVGGLIPPPFVLR
ncbi:MAG TPA: alpha/beta fold hydrolase [Gaiellaceae bacterium]|nr:alpha/beta fold hydrolase [Gaiellaceae bacterium]